ncbi:PREDICTED: retinoid-inducible serine carboxypeptidase-like [Bactrocera latifrons]|uniref:Retinoid-inducible serine carboxypeptidase n=2 Tax=Bactrocera latifrons TaxID=174628 RepID=A0A0K8W077_BACLA|nr:PREDICTED: retinoid-inducible serine carboxypeptidase-like [Bactrocera latifrons]
MRVELICTAILLAICVTATTAKTGYGPGEQDWGYVDVRTGAHMFYWLYYTTANVSKYTERPLAIWLQGGPGASSTGYGNFEELGPLDLYGNYRNFTWVKDMNVLFIDNPVGSGYSYVDSVLYLTKNNNEIALDLVRLMKGFYKQHPEFESVPLHIFCESYGGKMAPEFALELYYAIQRGELRSNLTSVALGDPWTSPIDSVLAWAPLLLQMGVVDQGGHAKIAAAANRTEDLINKGKWTQATNQWGATQSVLLRESKGVDFYNIETPTRGGAYANILLRSNNIKDLMYRTMVQYDIDIDEDRDQILQDLMRGPVHQALNISSKVRWGSQSDVTFARLNTDFMKPVIHIVEELLNNTTLQVGVYSGQLDLICATPGTVNWIEKMQWNNKTSYEAAPRVGISVNRILEGYEKSAGNFTMFWINRAGHMVPADNPAGMGHILRKYTNYG